jgi:hypothetical protein
MDERYWLAINGASFELCEFPLREPLVTPTPEQLFGFPTLEEAERAYQVFLNAPAKKFDRFIDELHADVKAGRIRHVRPKYPQPANDDVTAWTDSDEAHAMMQRAFGAERLN